MTTFSTRMSRNIPRTIALPGTLDFEDLVGRGITMLQSLAGGGWTDYNEHDPGVTMLQALCFGLTDLAYRTEHPEADLFLGAVRDQEAAKRNQALHAGDEALPCAPLTIEDYRRLLYDRVRGLQNAWLTPVASTVVDAGLYHVGIQGFPAAVQGETLESAEDLVAAVGALLHASRNLGEDFEYIEVCAQIPIFLAGSIEVSAEEHPRDIAADIMSKVQALLVPPPTVETLEEPPSPDEFFDGPSLSVGRISLPSRIWSGSLPGPAQFRRVLGSVPGVIGVRTGEDSGLRLLTKDSTDADHLTEDSTGARWTASTSARTTIPHGRLPRIQLALESGGFQLFREGVRLTLDQKDIDEGLANIRGRLRQFERQTATNLHRQSRAALPEGRDRNLGRYRSLQHFFPATYGLGPGGLDGMPVRLGSDGGTGGARREARLALQLKAYLLFFEQLLADHLAQLAQVPTLFSIDRDGESPDSTTPLRTIFTQPLAQSPDTSDHPPELRKVLRLNGRATEGPDDPLADLHRREAVLDHLLARYGEAIPRADELEWFGSTQEQVARVAERLTRKRAWLRDVIMLGRSRGLGLDYRRARLEWRSPFVGLPQPVGAARRAAWGAEHDRVALPAPTRFEQRLALLSGIRGPLYAVEHVLLRPRDLRRESQLDPDGLSILYMDPEAPEWANGERKSPSDADSDRGPASQRAPGRARPGHFVTRMLRANCPAHLDLQILALSPAAMGEFEVLYSAWLLAWQPDATPFHLGPKAPSWLPLDESMLRTIDETAGLLREFLHREAGLVMHPRGGPW